MTFKGVPINGTLNEFVSKLKQKGLAHIGTEEGIAMLKGDFAAYKNCTIAAVSLKQKEFSSQSWSNISFFGNMVITLK
ncbi:hypothetical protein NXY46_21465 [Bacteroides ovatus]|nr:hypothetical protein [Bacteroides ovatus]